MHEHQRNPLRHHAHYTDEAPRASFMERVSEKVASGMGTVGFLVVSSAIILAWVFANHLVTFLSASWTGLLNGKGFDPAPFILLNLMFSAVAFYTGALVIIAQKAQTRSDRLNEAAAAQHREELDAAQRELQQQQCDLLARNTDLTEEVHQLATQIHDLVQTHE